MARGGKRAGAGRKPGAANRKPAQHAKEARRQATRLAPSGITPDRVLKELARIGFADIRQVVSWRGNVSAMSVDEDTGEMSLSASNQVALVDSDKIDAETAAAIAEVSQTREGALKVKMHDKRSALLALAKHLGLLQPTKARSDADEEVAQPSDDGWDGLLGPSPAPRMQ